MFSRHLEKTYLLSRSQSKLEKREDTGLCNQHEQLQSDAYPGLLYTTDTNKRNSSDRKKVRPFENIYCYVFMCLVSNGLLNR
jgi:hypothetical protein